MAFAGRCFRAPVLGKKAASLTIVSTAKSQLRIDLSGLAKGVAVERAQDPCRRAFESIRKRIDDGEVGFFDLVSSSEIASQSKELAASVLDGRDTLVVLGMGGSSLGAQALCSALAQSAPASGEVAVRFVDNSDPRTLTWLLESVNLETTAFNVVTKSGSTSETCAQLMVVSNALSDALGEAGARERLVVTTDPVRGPLRDLATRHGLATLEVPPNVGGRFSVFSAVGLFPAAAAGIDVDALVAGANSMRERVLQSGDLFVNPALMLAGLAERHFREHHRGVTVMWVYADALERIGAWFQQLWAESLGKIGAKGDGVGLTPLIARGATDQHSMLQLFAQGPNDKLHLFVSPEHRESCPLTTSFLAEGDGFDYLADRDLCELIEAQQLGTLTSLAALGRPVSELTLASVNETAVGELLMLLMAATAFAGPLFGVDPFDQPGVEQAKRLAFAAFGRDGYADEEIISQLKDPAYVF